MIRPEGFPVTRLQYHSNRTSDTVPLASGTRLGAYEILAAIGAGGMGEVYRARDTRLRRDVAIKVLPETLAHDPERLARFAREAQLLASLNHPNIAHIYGVEGEAGLEGQTRLEGQPRHLAIVMELVDGPTLAELLASDSRHPATGAGRALPLSDTLAFARQIADALDAAHERCVVHRDLKPANIKITPDGLVKVLDFGLAKIVAGDASDVNAAESPTMTAEATRRGVLLGTAAYMSPEQARGQAVDKRTDIWAFGCILYEMLTGDALFARDTITDTLVAIVDRQVDVSKLPPDTPSGVRRLLQRCLEKDSRRRLRDIGDARIDLEAAPEADMASTRQPSSRSAAPLVWLLAGVAATAVAVGAFSAWSRPRESPPARVQVQRITDSVGVERSPAISPDGKTVAFVASAEGKRQIWVRLLAGGVPLQITHDATDHEEPRWTPDSSALIYYTPAETGDIGTVWEIAALGGTPRRITSAVGGGDVSHDGRYVAVVRPAGGHLELITVARDGSGERSVRTLSGEGVFGSPRWSPDDRMIALQRNDILQFDQRIVIVRLDGGEPLEIARADFLQGFAWGPGGSAIVFSSSAGSTVLYPPVYSLWLVDTNGRNARPLTFGDVSYEDPDVDRNGRIVASRIRVQSDIWKFPVGGSPEENTRGGIHITRQTGLAQTPSISPDEHEVVYLSDSGGHGNLWVTRTDGSGVRQLTVERDPAVSIGVPVWSPVGNQIVYIVTRLGRTALWLIDGDGRNPHEIAHGTWAAWSPDGRWVYYQPVRPGPFCLEKVPIEGGPPVSVRCDGAGAPAVGSSALYFVTAARTETYGWSDWDIRAASPEDGPSRSLGHVEAARVPLGSFMFHMFVSPDEQSLALPLCDGDTCDLWLQPTAGGAMRRVTAFGDRPVVIARRVSWSKDGRSIYAPIADIDADIVLLDGLVR